MSGGNGKEGEQPVVEETAEDSPVYTGRQDWQHGIGKPVAPDGKTTISDEVAQKLDFRALGRDDLTDATHNARFYGRSELLSTEEQRFINRRLKEDLRNQKRRKKK